MNTPTNPTPSAADNAPTPRTGSKKFVVETTTPSGPFEHEVVLASDYAELERELAASEAANRKASEDAILMRDGLLKQLAAKDREIAKLKADGAADAFVDMAVRAEKAEQLAREAMAELAQLKTKVEQGGIITEDMEHLLDERDALRAEVERLKAHEGDLVIGAAILNGARQQEAESVDQLRARLGTAEAALAAAQLDKERLDWLEANWLHWPVGNTSHDTIRDAIDAARKAQP